MKIDELRPWLTVSAALYTLIAIFATPVYSQTPFYQGKTITIIHGRAPGGSGDLRVRAVIPFLQKYIPGNPSFVHEYMDGGGGRKAANFVFSQARADGLNVGNVGGGVVANAILGEQGVQYDLDKMPFIGSPYSATHYMFVTRRDVGLRNLEKLRGYSGLRIGAQSVGHTNYTLGRIFAAVLGLKDTKYVTGYSIPERDVALMRGEIDAITNSDDFYARNPEWVQKELVDFHIVMEIPKGEKHPLFSKCRRSTRLRKTSTRASCSRCSDCSGFPVRRSFCRRQHLKIARRSSKRDCAKPSKTRTLSKNTKESSVKIRRRYCRMKTNALYATCPVIRKQWNCSKNLLVRVRYRRCEATYSKVTTNAAKT
jgi:hypothetical protein